MYQHPLPGTHTSAWIRSKATAFSLGISVLAALLHPGNRMTERMVMGRQNCGWCRWRTTSQPLYYEVRKGKTGTQKLISEAWTRLRSVGGVAQSEMRTHSPSVVLNKARQWIGRWVQGSHWEREKQPVWLMQCSPMSVCENTNWREDDISNWQKYLSMTVRLSSQGPIFPRWPEVYDISFKSRSELFSFHIRQKQL